jgi:hypothetical protein
MYFTKGGAGIAKVVMISCRCWTDSGYAGYWPPCAGRAYVEPVQELKWPALQPINALISDNQDHAVVELRDRSWSDRPTLGNGIYAYIE